MIYRSTRVNAFTFAVIAGLRAKQLTRGAVPQVAGNAKPVTTAQLEVLAGKVFDISHEVTLEPSEVRTPAKRPHVRGLTTERRTTAAG